MSELVGRERRYTAPEELGRAAIRYFAQAVGDDNPLYTDDDHARAHGYDGVVAPPTLICETNQYTGLPRDEDGHSGHSWHFVLPDTRLVRGGNSYEFHRPVRPGDIVTALWRIEEVTERVNARGQAMTVVTSVARYTDQRGDPLATNKETLIYVHLAGGSSGGLLGKSSERSAKGSSEESPGGSPGGLLGKSSEGSAKGSSEESPGKPPGSSPESGRGAVRETAGAPERTALAPEIGAEVPASEISATVPVSGLGAEVPVSEPDAEISAPEIGAEVPVLERRIKPADMIAYAGATWDWYRLHYDPAFAASKGLPAPVVDGQLLGALLAEQLQDWLGPSAVLEKLHFRFAAMVFAGETVRCTGRVTAAGDGHVVVEQRVEVVGDDPRVAVRVAGATVRLNGPRA
ncbi:FAS1-like dehydratase domain-containing protein [Streptosporangium sp. NBC_01756]|uniref:FAS1-like dehydratase domain-containing protein n=1 Tax=Streptosporangium sp. NBC_01756 TaxID=2975950 RepID=UPI002DDA2F10|nr:MaoC family dehydratase N-terminal domain-containing protein [Streptosporangium sp. NBC_01756]WSC85771.1 MaoC family dehydratase N-terminal domain-containing protein [Streptosporangium sp. NBC_01756]